MNRYQVFILATLFIRYVLLLGEWISARRGDPQLPDEVKDVYDPEKFRKSREYLITTTTFRVIHETFSLAVLLVFWFSGGFDYIDRIVRARGYGEMAAGVAYIGIVVLAGIILNLPFEAYSTFVIEERFGFNRTSLRTFVTDRVKTLSLLCLLGVPFLVAVLWFFERTGRPAWIYCWMVTVVVTAFIHFVAPVWILPLFNKLTPLADGELKRAIVDYAQRVGFAFKEIFVMDSSRRTSKTNAFFAGFGRNKRIALFDTLVKESTAPEVVAVLAHEVGHYKKKHIVLSMSFSFLYAGFVFYLLSLFIGDRRLFDAFYMRDVSVYASLLFFAMLYEPISFLIAIPLNAISRMHEKQADRYAVDTTPDAEQLVSALKKLYATNLSNLKPHRLYVVLHYSHPPLLERLSEIRKAKAAISSGQQKVEVQGRV